MTMALVMPLISTFFKSAFARPALMSLEMSSPVPPSLAASWVVFPPGAAQISSTKSPSSMGIMAPGVMALGSCK